MFWQQVKYARLTNECINVNKTSFALQEGHGAMLLCMSVYCVCLCVNRHACHAVRQHLVSSQSLCKSHGIVFGKVLLLQTALAYGVS